MTTISPSMIQHVSSSSNPAGVGPSGPFNAFKFTLPNAVGSGNCLVLGITYPSGATPTITDNNGNSWTGKLEVTADPGAGTYKSDIWVLPNANAGLTQVTITFGSAIAPPFQYTITEFCGIATATPVNGTATTGAVGPSGPGLTTGSLTPGNNNANGGNIIWSYHAIAVGASSNPTSWVPGGSFALLDGDIAWVNNQGFPHASQWFLQATSASINPGITATGDSSDSYNSLAVALKAANAGTAKPSGIHVDRIIHQTSVTTGGTSWVLQLPTTGNLRMISWAATSSNVNITSITDSDGHTWVRRDAGNGTQVWDAVNCSPNAALLVTLHLGGTTDPFSGRFYDISGAAAAPFDTIVESPQTDVSNQTTISNFPSITPTTTNGLVICCSALGLGPITGVPSPTGNIYDIVAYTGMTDQDLMDNADGLTHVYNATTAQLNWTWNFGTQTSNGIWASAVAYKKA